MIYYIHLVSGHIPPYYQPPEQSSWVIRDINLPLSHRAASRIQVGNRIRDIFSEPTINANIGFLQKAKLASGWRHLCATLVSQVALQLVAISIPTRGNPFQISLLALGLVTISLLAIALVIEAHWQKKAKQFDLLILRWQHLNDAAPQNNHKLTAAIAG
jgi:hypothetical protein